MTRRSLVLVLLILTSVPLARADQITERVQQTLKDQGFYYGEVTGKKSSETTAAIRRYQIRNGLQITGEIDAETLRSLGIGRGAADLSPPPQPAATPPPAADDNRAADEPPTQSAEIYSPPRAPYAPGTAAAPNENFARGLANVFAGTPYELAPPDLQRHVIVGAQSLLARWGYYRSGIDGNFGAGTVAALRLFQSRNALPPDGHLNMATLSALGLLPGQRARSYATPPRIYRGRPVYRGQWIPDR